jgi:hypothetical protein
MTEFDSSGAGRELAPVPASEPDSPGSGAAGAAGSGAPRRGPSRDLVPVVEPPEAKFAGAPQGAPGRRFSRFHLAAAAALAIVAGVGGALLVENREQAKALADRTIETESLAHAVKSLKVRVDAIDTAVSNAALADLRQSVGEIKSNTASERQISGALAQLSQRVDRLDRESSAKADKLTERVDRQAGAVAAGLSTRIDKLEQKIATPPPPPPQAAAQPKPPPRPRFGAVALDRTGSIDRPRPILRGYVVLGARDDVALIGGRYGEREVREGDFLPGAGRVERIEARGDQWVVMTSEGLIAETDFPPY